MCIFIPSYFFQSWIECLPKFLIRDSWSECFPCTATSSDSKDSTWTWTLGVDVCRDRGLTASLYQIKDKIVVVQSRKHLHPTAWTYPGSPHHQFASASNLIVMGSPVYFRIPLDWNLHLGTLNLRILPSLYESLGCSSMSCYKACRAGSWIWGGYVGFSESSIPLVGAFTHVPVDCSNVYLRLINRRDTQLTSAR